MTTELPSNRTVLGIALLVGLSAAPCLRPLHALDIPARFRESKDSVVLIFALDQNNRPLKLGSGFIVGDGGDVITNLHVVQGSSAVEIKTTSGEVIKIHEVIGFDEVHDLAVLALGQKKQPLRLDSRTPVVGEEVIAIGNPQGLESTVSAGIVSAIRRDRESTYYQITAAISPGSSGGPILDKEGNVLAVATFQVREGQNLNFATPAGYVKKLQTARLVTELRKLPASSESGTREEGIVVVRTTADEVAIYQPKYPICVTTEGDEGLYGRKIGAVTEDVLTETGGIVGDFDSCDYSLTVHPVQEASSVSREQVFDGGDDAYLHGNRYVPVVGDKTDSVDGFAFKLYDMKEFEDSGVIRKPPIVWTGIVVGARAEVRARSREMIRQVLLHLGKSGEAVVKISEESPQKKNWPVQERAASQRLEYFPDSGMLINEMRGTFKGREFKGYIKTRRIQTQKFDGYVQTWGLSQFRPNAEADELESNLLGLGAMVVVDGAVWTTHYDAGREQDLNQRNLKKLFSLPLTVGQEATVTLVDNYRLHFEVERHESVRTPLKAFDDCFVIKSTLDTSGTMDAPTRAWICPGGGVVRIVSATGRIDELTNIQVR